MGPLDKLDDERVIAITMDLDWASPQQTEEVMQTLSTLGVDKVTPFVPPYDDKKEQDTVLLILGSWLGRAGQKHIGIHPVPFRQNVNMGYNDPEMARGPALKRAIDNAVEVLPKADFYRCHGLYDSHWLQKEMKDRGYKYCSNRCEWAGWKPKPRKNAAGLWDIPIWWEDSIEFRGWNTIYDAPEETKRGIFSMKTRASGDETDPIQGNVVINLHPQYITQWTPWIAKLMEYKPRLDWLREMIPSE